jgi:hypothetical protein
LPFDRFVSPTTFTETERRDLACDCGCGKTFFLSRGALSADGETTEVVVAPTVHEDERAAWIALSIDGAWVLLKSWLQGENLASALVDPSASLLAEAISGPARSRAQVLADPALKASVFAVADKLAAAHPEMRFVLYPGEERDFSLKMPDCVFAAPRAARSPNNQLNFAEHEGRMFVRALLPLPLADGTELRIGIWIEVPRPKFFELLQVWNDAPAYLAMELTGPIESSLSLLGHGTRSARVTLAARTADQCLFVRDTDAEWLASAMTTPLSPRLLSALMAEAKASSPGFSGRS